MGVFYMFTLVCGNKICMCMYMCDWNSPVIMPLIVSGSDKSRCVQSRETGRHTPLHKLCLVTGWYHIPVARSAVVCSVWCDKTFPAFLAFSCVSRLWNFCSHRRCERDFILIPTHFYHATTLQLCAFAWHSATWPAGPMIIRHFDIS